MERHQELSLVALITSFAIIHFVQPQTQEGFISLDCGLPPKVHYIHPISGLEFSSDSSFIQSGKIGSINKNLEGEFEKKLRTLRYFPDGDRNCYSLNVKKGTSYLIRASFFYGNYDGHNTYPYFDLHIGPNYWTSIYFNEKESTAFPEIMHAPMSDFVDVCLVRTDSSSTPFISSLELRPLPNNSYVITSGSLTSMLRYYFSDSKTKIQSPNDAYDRVWLPFSIPSLKQISTNVKSNNSGSFVLPQAVITTAETPANVSESFKIFVDTAAKIYYFLHFSEVQELEFNETREFDILWNGKVIAESYKPEYLQPKTEFNKDPVTCEKDECVLELKKTQRSTLTPLLNAIEIYGVTDFRQSKTNENDVLAIRNIKATYGLKKISWQGDPCVPVYFGWVGVSCYIVNESTPPIITSLNLSSSGLTGTIAEAIQNLTYLKTLDLSNNKLVGVVPDFLANMKYLTFINLSKNNLYDSTPQALRDRENKGLIKIIFDGKPCISGSCAPKKKFPVMNIIAAVVVVVVIVAVLVLIYVAKRKKASNHVEDLTTSSKSWYANAASTDKTDPSIETKRRKFSYLEVITMTKNLERPLGEGGFGVVYHGEVNSSPVAVKLLSKTSAQGYKEFKAEVDLLLRVHHINLVSLVGYCDERDHLALIYEYMPNLDLKHHLLGKDGASVLSWSTRLQIAIGSALGLEYLHNGCRPPMVHRDIKCTNILLDEHFSAKIADFGLSRSFQFREESHISTAVAGTPGYLDPEYYRTGRLAEMSDVYSFGIVLLEIMTNQRVIDQTRENPHITEWTISMLNRCDITKIMDPNLNGDYNSLSVWRALELAMLCANPSSENRPSISQVVIELKECLISENKMRSNNQGIDSSSSLEVSMSSDTKAVPSAR